MLRSTHKSQGPSSGTPPLPPGWSEHKAPTGHSYYYNAGTKQSTYTRPTLQPEQPAPLPFDHVATAPTFPSSANFGARQRNGNGHGGPATFTGGRGYQDRRPRPQDRPKHKYVVPDAEPWVLIKTRLGRRFVHNTKTGESLWRFPEHVMKAVVEWDVQKLKEKERRERGETEDNLEEDAGQSPEEELGNESGNEGGRPVIVKSAAGEADRDEDEGSEEEYEEVEVTDEEAEEGEDEDEDGGGPSKRQRTDELAENHPLEFDEDDIAYQLQAMGQDYGLDDGEYGIDQDQEWEEGAEGLPLTEGDSKALFCDLLDDHNVNPYKMWEQVIDDGRIIDDERYTALSNMKSRKEAFSDWSRERIQVLKEQREREAKKDPRIPYLAFLQKKATPKLYWPEFKRKYKKEPEMRDTKVSDKDREKFYRDHLKSLQLTESTRKSDLSALMKTIPLSALNRSTSINALPQVLLADLKYISLPPEVRDPLIQAYITTLAPAPDAEASAEDEMDVSARRKDSERREKALAERERRVQEDKNRQRRELEYGKGRLREEQWELDKAMRVGKDGLRAQLGGLGMGNDPQSDENS